MRNWKTCGLVTAAWAAIAVPAHANDKLGVADASAFLMDREAEIALSRSAAPAAISNDATVLVLEQDGSYTTAIEGSNGWTCFTGRSWTGPARYKDGKKVWTPEHFNPKARAPQCFNAAGAVSVLELHKLTTSHFLKGASTEDVDLAIGRALAAGTLPTPEIGAMSYMYSPDQHLSDEVGRFMPHLMIYQPFASQKDFGAPNKQMTVPLVGDGGTVFATTVVMSAYWSDGTPAMDHGG